MLEVSQMATSAIEGSRMHRVSLGSAELALELAGRDIRISSEIAVRDAA